MKKTTMWRVGAALAFAVALTVNGLAGSTTLLGGRDTAAVSEAYPTLFTPAGYTFAIWGLIYGLVILYVLYQFGVFGKIATDKQKAIDAITPWFAGLSVTNAAWIFAWQYNVIWLALLLIVAMLVILIRINEILRGLTYTKQESLLLRVPFSVYYGWLTVATVANACVWLVSVGWDGWGVGAVAWLVTILWISAAIGVAAVLRNKDWSYGLVFVWAYIGILLSREQQDVSVAVNLAFLIAVLAFASGFVLSTATQKPGLLTRLFKRHSA